MKKFLLLYLFIGVAAFNLFSEDGDLKAIDISWATNRIEQVKEEITYSQVYYFKVGKINPSS